MARYCVLSLLYVTICFTTFTCQELNENESIDVSRIKREGVPENRDLTVLLVNDQNRNDYNTKIGRYHSVKPLIGLLTSTARTFIQDGVTTEFATQILGTTLDNGRIYAQLLTKSSLVLYNKPSNVGDPFIVKPTRVHSAFDGQWNVKQDLGIIDPDKFILKNTDYLAPSSKMEIVYASKPAQDSFKLWNPPSSPDYQSENQIYDEPIARKAQTYIEEPQFEVYNYLDGPTVENEKKSEPHPNFLDNVNSLHRQSKAYEPVTEPVKVDSKVDSDVLNESNIVKVKPNYDLPTFTIKNEFSPIFYYIDNVESPRSPQQSLPQTKLPKKLFGHKSEPRPKKTFTYAGFADFTTVVGDTVIIFTPNTETVSPPNPDEVNVFPSAKPADKLATKVTFLSADIPVATSTFKAHEANSATEIPNSSSDDNRSEKALFNDEESLKKVLYEVDDKIPDAVSVQYNNGFDLNMDVIQPSEASFSTTESTRYTEDLEDTPVKKFNFEATDPLSSLVPSATTRFGEDESKESVVTESNVRDFFTNSEEETENTAAEVTEKIQEEEEEEPQEDESTQEPEAEVQTTTESGHSDESYEIETTTENKFNKHEEVYCSDGLDIQSTMTTEYKTLTYLTTYFIPLESTETTTSIKSDVVVESNVGYITNYVCKTDLDIEPTSVVSSVAQNTDKSNIERPEIVAQSEANSESITENPSKTTVQMKKEDLTTTLEQEEKVSDGKEKNSGSVDTVPQNDSSPSTTTESVSTSQSHIEVSVSTEHTPTDSDSSAEEDDSENEIDLIYKTLYTTYTYFTTFFGDQTSSVASHKSVVTNIITSTIDLSKLDPSLLGVFDEDEIAPTSVGVGRPTESFAINSIIDLVKNKDVIESVEIDKLYSSQTPTPSLGDDIIASIKPDTVKTYYTTYTFFTTIFVGSDANVCSRREVYTNYVGPDELIPTKTNPLAAETSKAQFDFRNCKQVKGMSSQSTDDNSSVESSVSMDQNTLEENKGKETTPQPSPIEVDMLFSVESNPLSENSFVTDVKSSSSKGESKYLDNNNVLDDQVSSESNIDEILPSPTLLLQTSYTTFTYFTTMYIGKDSSKVKSRLETITNVVTETITPKTEPEEENNLPITYYTTFTYWTTLYKDKSTTITSREEIVSNVVTPTAQSIPTVNPIDTTPIDVVSVLPPKDLEIELKPSLVEDNLEHDDGKATFYTTYTYFTTFYAGNTSLIRSSLETVTNIVDNTKLVEDNQLGRKVGGGLVDKNLIQDIGEKPHIIPTAVKEEIIATKIPDPSNVSSTVLQGTYIDNLFAEVKPDTNTPKPDTDKKILFSQVAVISGDSTIVTNNNKTLEDTTTTTTTTSTPSTSTTTEGSIITPAPEVIQSSVTDLETTTETLLEEDSEDDDPNSKKKGRLTFTTKKPSFTPVIIPFASRNRPTFSPKRLPVPNSATTITRADFTPTITATPTLKSARPTGSFNGNRKVAASPGSSSSGRRFTGRSSASINLSANTPASRAGGFPRGNISPSSRRTGFRSSSLRSNSLDYASRSAIPRIRPTASSRLRGSRQSASVSYPPADQNEFETFATQQEETATESLDELSEFSNRQTTNNPLLRFRRPLVPRQPGTAITPRSTTPSSRRSATTRSRTTTTRRSTTRSTTNPLLSLRRQRPNNSLFPKRNLFKQPEPEPEEEIGENEQKVDESEELLDEEEFEEDNDYESSDRKEQQVATPASPALRKNPNAVQIRPFAFKRRTKRQVDYGNRKFTNFRRPGIKSASTRRPEPEPETEPPAPPAPKQKAGRYISRTSGNTRSTTAAAPKVSQRQPFIVRGESRSTTTSAPSYRRGKTRTSSRTTTLASRPKAPRLTGKSTQSSRLSKTTQSSRPTSRSRSRTTTSRASSRQRNSFENLSGERFNKYDNILNDGKITITHQIPFEVTIPVVNGKVTEYKNVLSAKPSIETLLLEQVSTSIGPIGNQQLVLALESTELGDNGATKITKFVLHETPTTTVIFTPTTIRGRKTSYSHVLPSTVYNVEPVVQTVAPEINSNVPLANLLLSQLLLGNQQPAINPLLALQGQGLLPQQPVVQTPVTEYKVRTTTYVTTVTDARETVLTITFRATPIETTIVNPTSDIITATEFITETIVTTPTVLAPPPQYNSLLLPLLLQQQQQQQQQQQALSLQTSNPLLGLAQPDLNLLQNNLVPNNNLNNDIYSNSPKPNILTDLSSNEDFSDDLQNSGEDIPPPPPKPTRKRSKPKPKPAPVAPKLTSIVTLYVSGRHPGEFSTVLSTVISDDTQTVRKREAIYYENIKILPSILPSIDQIVSSQDDSLVENSIISDMDKYLANDQTGSQIETQSLESIIGKVSDHVNYDASPTYVVKLATRSTLRDSNQSSVDDVS
ncbi:mucin-5AC isoform X5 [Bicyclus anynana]|uniref:Mucin-5AC isoform X5 n=1 Tax=Bicyclus anynana TaxID=110368 RepID=A0ABM3M1H2_BICAN|nr:mucin-5AC isoform X5 [Bicyclus anynana]